MDFTTHKALNRKQNCNVRYIINQETKFEDFFLYIVTQVRQSIQYKSVKS